MRALHHTFRTRRVCPLLYNETHNQKYSRLIRTIQNTNCKVLLIFGYILFPFAPSSTSFSVVTNPSYLSSWAICTFPSASYSTLPRLKLKRKGKKGGLSKTFRMSEPCLAEEPCFSKTNGGMDLLLSKHNRGIQASQDHYQNAPSLTGLKKLKAAFSLHGYFISFPVE